jgi:hypothetical protein
LFKGVDEVLSSLLDKISGFFDKAFLVAAVLPILLVLLAILICAGAEFGLGNLAEMIDRVPASTISSVSAAFALILFVLAYALRTVRALILAIWSGDHPIWSIIGLSTPLLYWQRRKRAKLERIRYQSRVWGGAPAEVRSALNKAAGNLSPPRSETIPISEETELSQRINTFRDELGEPPEFKDLVCKVSEAYSKYEKSSIENLDFLLCDVATRMEQIERLPVQGALA